VPLVHAKRRDAPRGVSTPLALALVHWWTHLQPGNRGTSVGGLATFLTLAATLIITAVSWMRQRSREVKLREAEQDAARRSHAEKFSCWVSGRINSSSKAVQVHAG
jgi:hypothetical protein